VVPSRFISKYVLAEKSASDGAAIMVDEFSRKMKGCCDVWAGKRSCDVCAWWMVDGWSQRKRIQIPRLLHDVIEIIDV
jgi:hypothetical protein